jgi:hypothetical protein
MSLLRILVLLVVAILFSHCSKSANNANLPGARANTLGNGYEGRPGDPAKIEGDDPPAYLVYKSDLAYLQTIEPPKIRFVFRSSTVEMPSGARDTALAHWKEAIKFYHNDYFNKPKNAGEIEAREDVWQKFSRETEKKLQDISIAAPEGSRYMTSLEAKAVRSFLDQAAQRIINQAKSPAQPAGPA